MIQQMLLRDPVSGDEVALWFKCPYTGGQYIEHLKLTHDQLRSYFERKKVIRTHACFHDSWTGEPIALPTSGTCKWHPTGCPLIDYRSSGHAVAVTTALTELLAGFTPGTLAGVTDPEARLLWPVPWDCIVIAGVYATDALERGVELPHPDVTAAIIWSGREKWLRFLPVTVPDERQRIHVGLTADADDLERGDIVSTNGSSGTRVLARVLEIEPLEGRAMVERLGAIDG